MTLSKYNNEEADIMFERHNDLQYFKYCNREKAVSEIEYAASHNCGITMDLFYGLYKIHYSSKMLEYHARKYGVVSKYENIMVHNAIAFEAIYKNLKLGINWKKVASCHHAERWCDASAYFRWLYNANYIYDYRRPSWFTDDINPETWLKSNDAFYKHYYKVLCAYKALPTEARDNVFQAMVNFIEISQDILCNACLYLAALQRGNDPECECISVRDIDSMLECAYIINEACNYLKIKY